MSLLFRASFAFLVAFAAVQPQALTSAFGTSRLAELKVDLATAERNEAAKSSLDAAFFRAAGVLRTTARASGAKF